MVRYHGDTPWYCATRFQVHGELPNAPYQTAHIGVGSDDRGSFLEIGGVYDHTVAFTCNYRATASIRLYAGESTFPISMHLKNNFHQDMDLMYMASLESRR